MGTEKLCACDRTRQTALCAEIDFVDTVNEPFLTIVKGLSDVKDGLWLSPFRGIPRGPQVSRFDVIYLDEDCKVLDYVVNFAESEFEPIPEIASSALVLPAHSLGSFPIRKGDQLRICQGKRVLAGAHDLGSTTGFEETPPCATYIKAPTVQSTQADEESVAKPGVATSASEEEKPSFKVRFLRWLFPNPAPSDRRRGERLPEPGLVAYYWTGGSPNSYPLGNVSSSGLYLMTDERWLPGTRIVMTLQRHNSSAVKTDDVCRVESKVVRWGEDGVGCEFVESGFFDLNNGEVIEGKTFDHAAFEQFLHRDRGIGPGPQQSTIQ
jgi:hypothetical protein